MSAARRYGTFAFVLCGVRVRRGRVISSAVSVLLLLTACMTGCGSAGSTDAALTLRVWYSTDDPVERVWSQQLARRFEGSHPHVKVLLTDYSFADLNTKLQLALTAGNPPDVAYVTPRGPGVPAYVGAHKVRDLTADARRHKWGAKLRPGLLAQYNRPFSYLGIRTGSVVAVPTSLAAVGVLYNRRLLRKLHLTIPNSIPEFERALVSAAAGGYTPIGMGNADGWLGDDWYLTLVNALVSPSVLQPEQRLDRTFSFRRPPYLQAGRLLQRWSSHSYFTANFGGLDAQEGLDLFFQGKTLFHMVSSSQNSQILRDQRQTHLPVGIFAFPGPRGRVMPQSGYLGWVVPARAAHTSGAISFIDSLLTPGTSNLLLREGLLPAFHATGGKRVALEGPSAPTPFWQQEYLRALDTAQPGIYLDAAPIANLNATMEANVQLLLQGYEPPEFLVNSLQEVYTSHGNRGSTARIDGEF